MKSIFFFPSLFLLFLIASVSHAQTWDLTVPGQITTTDKVGISNSSPSTNLNIGTSNSGSTVTTPTMKLSIQEDNPWIELKDVNGTYAGASSGNVGGTAGIQIQTPTDQVVLTSGFTGPAMGPVASFKKSSNGLGYHIANNTLWIGLAGSTLGNSMITFSETTRFNQPTYYYTNTNEFGALKAGMNNLVMDNVVLNVNGTQSVAGDINITRRLGVGVNANTGTALAVKAADWSDWAQWRRADNSFWAIHNPQYEDRMSFYYSNASGTKYFDVLNLINTGNTGSVGIGTQCVPTGYKLAVKGKIICEELKVKLEGGNCWADFVFDKDYRLRSLPEVENYIKKNHHLPEVPSANEVEAQGITVSEMMIIQMRKIEELTLYMIELKKENEWLKKKVEELSSKQ